MYLDVDFGQMRIDVGRAVAMATALHQIPHTTCVPYLVQTLDMNYGYEVLRHRD